MERLKAALENLDQAIDMAEAALERRARNLDHIVEKKAERRVRAATDTAERALRQARQGESAAEARVTKQGEIAGIVAGKLDQAISRIERLAGMGGA